MNDYEYVISIEDNGTGISPEHMGAIFEPYRTTKSSGSGLGLLIVRRIIREHGGQIAIESEENQGTRVLIHLPARRAAGEIARRAGTRSGHRSLISTFTPMLPTLLIVEDERATREGLRSALEEEFDVYTAAGTSEALAILKSEPIKLLLTDLRLGGDSGMDLLDAALALPEPPVAIMMTAYGSVDTAVEAMRRGAWHFVTKPLNLDEVEMLLKRALRNRTLEVENQQLVQQVKKIPQARPPDRQIRRHRPGVRARPAGRADAGHRAHRGRIRHRQGSGGRHAAPSSGRPAAKMVIVHCAALSPQLLESELFGHEKGAFTGAAQRRIGRFEQADGGTLFLDEIGEIDAATQVKLLRVLSERTLERVGSNSPIKVDVRVIAATNKNLKELVAQRHFPRGSLFPPQRGENRDAAAARPAGGHRAAGEQLPPGIRQGKRPPGEAAVGRGDETAARLLVARQRPRAADRHRARRGDEQRSR